MPTNYCYLDKQGRPYGVGHESPSSAPTHMINYTVVAIVEDDDE